VHPETYDKSNAPYVEQQLSQQTNVLKFSGVFSPINVEQLNLDVAIHQENFSVTTPCQHHHFFTGCKCLEFRKEGSLTCQSEDLTEVIKKNGTCTLRIKKPITLILKHIFKIIFIPLLYGLRE
jgi:hypothetical protein